MPNLVNLLENIAQIVNADHESERMFSSLDMLYAYGQTFLHPDTAKHCDFQIVVASRPEHTRSKLAIMD